MSEAGTKDSKYIREQTVGEDILAVTQDSLKEIIVQGHSRRRTNGRWTVKVLEC